MIKKSWLFVFLVIFLGNMVWSQTPNLRVFLQENYFYTQENGNYIEVQLAFDGSSVQYIQQNDSIYGTIEISQVFSQNDSIIIADKYRLNSPVVRDSIFVDFYDIQKYGLNVGNYQYQLTIKDVNSKNKPLSVSKEINIKDLSSLSFSSFITANSIVPNPSPQRNIFTKAGYDVIPMIGKYYPEGMTNFLYYIELYNSDTYLPDSIYVIEQTITDQSNNTILEPYTRYFRYRSSPIQTIAKAVDITNLPSGSYTITLNLLNREKESLLSTDFTFDRNNSEEMDALSIKNTVIDPAFRESIPIDSADYYMASLIPISNPAEVKNIIALLKEKNNEKNFKYLQAFWKKISPIKPFDAWIKYKAQVQLVERLYATNFQVGFETDRGRVYLEYGAPSSIIERPSSPSEYPYEIWQYDRIDRFSNRRFVFYSPTNLNKDYRLLHSDMLGEIQNKNWQFELNKRNTPNGSGTVDHFGGNARRYYNSY